MEHSLLEPIYGDLGHGHWESPVAHSEDSVDIYSGLDNSPRNSQNSDKSCAPFSPRRLKDSMDLYEEIIKEEQQEKESTCNELKIKLDAAQNHVKELLKKLEQIQVQNTSLHTQNTCLKKNICALIKTARMEILRKDDEISRLSQRGGRGSFTRSQFHFQRNQDASLNSALAHDPVARPETQGSRGNCVPKALPKPHSDARSVSLHPEPLATSLLPPPPSVNSGSRRTNSAVHDRLSDLPVSNSDRESNTLQTPNQSSLVQQTGKSCLGNNDKPKDSGKQAFACQDISRKLQCSEVGDHQDHHSALDASKENKFNSREKSGRESKQFEKDCVNSSRGRHQPLYSQEVRGSSERGKSPPHQRNHSPPIGSSHRTTSSSRSQKIRSRDIEPPAKGSSRESRYSHSRERGDRNALKSFDREGKRSDSDQGRPTKLSASSSRKGPGSPLREHSRKEERSREERCWNRERKGNVTDKSKEYERNKGKDTDKSLRDSSRKVEEKKDKLLDSKVDSKNGKQTTPNITVSTGCRDLAKKGQEVRKGQDKHLALVQAKVPVNSVEPEIAVGQAGEKSLPEEGNRNRKLSFMETLNLTLSPVKTQRLSSKELESGQSEDAPEGPDGPDEETSQFNLGEEFCVIDELDSSNEASNEMDEVFEAPAAENCEAEKGQEPLPELELKNIEKGNAQDKEEGVVQTPISSTQTKCDSENILEENAVLQSADSKLPNPCVDQPPKLATSQKPIDSKDSGATSKMVQGDVITAQPTESPSSATESLTAASLGQSVLIADDIHVGSSNGESRSSLMSVSPSVKCVESVANDPAIVWIIENYSSDKSYNAQSECQKSPLALPPETISQASTSVPVDVPPKVDEIGEEASDVSTDAVSSTVSIEVVSQSSDSVVPGVMETVVISSTKPEKYVEKPVTNHSFTKAQSAETPKVSSTFRDEIVQPGQGHCGSLPMAQDCCISEPDSTEDEEWNNRTEPSSSVPVAHDEDSMMMTLRNIKHIPDAISPLTSPVRPVKKNLPQSSGNAQHVRSLSKDLSILSGARRMDVNKENEKPHCSSTQFPHTDPNQTPPSPSSHSEDDDGLEEGEIVSDSEEDEPSVNPCPQLGKTQSVTAIKKHPSPKSPRLAKKLAQKPAVISQGHSGMKSKTTSAPNDSPTSSKKHKTVLPLLPQTNPSSIHEVMDMLKLIQGHLRKKYMKFHKNFPKKLFYNIIDMSLRSLTDFVNNVSFSKFCSLESILKPKLTRIISSTMSKISNNGIVNRIFEQQSPNLKKKLWTFVEDQFEFLFREIQATLTSLCSPPEVRHFPKTENKVERNGGKKISKMPAKPPVTTVPTLKRKAAEVDLVHMSGVQNKIKPPTNKPLRTGLGSRGKNLKMNNEEEDQASKAQDSASFHSPSKTALTQSKNSSSGEKPAACVRRLSHNSSIQDKSDFEILTEQQASSLTFNLVTDSQMGEIFKCLLQGSDLLENSVSVGDTHCWPVGTPRKDSAGGESSFLVTTPNKITLTPSKLITTWSAISPCKPSTPSPKIRIPLNPAVLDESCLLEVPSRALPFCRETPSSTVPSQRSYSVLAEDLAVSLTIPSPLKSDSHLSFLHPDSAEPMSAPESVISAHYSEDALMDGEDATEQDIHLALDSDNSSAGSSGCREDAAMPTFLFKPHLPMQAVVMEKSNDHFIVRIRHTSTSFATSPDQSPTSADNASQKETGARVESIDSAHSTPGTSPNGNSPGQSQSPVSSNNPDLHLPKEVPLKDSLSGSSPPGKTVNCHNVVVHSRGKTVEPASTNSEIAESASPSELVIVTEEGTASKKSCTIRKKRKKHHSEPRAKRVKREHTQEKVHKRRKKRSSGGSKEKGLRTPRKKRNKSKSPPLSPNSLSAKNVIRKKGEVVVTWTREEDRDILVELKLKGASPDTFSALSAKMNKPPALIAERFCQLMKLFKKKEKMDS